MKYTRLGDLLIDAGIIDDTQLNEALAAQKKTKKRLGDTLVEEGFITERQLINALTMQLGIEYVDLGAVEIDPAMTKLVSKNLAKKYSVVPVRTKGDDIYLAMVDPLNFLATEEVKAASRHHVVPMIATQAAITRAINALYGTVGAKRAIREMQAERAEDDKAPNFGKVTLNQLDQAQSAPSIRLVDSIIERGISDRASDIHIEPHENNMVVRMRVDGILQQVLTIPKELQQSVTSRIKIMCNMDVTERRVPQDGRAIVSIRMHEADLRASTLPCVDGEKIVLRILDRENQKMTAEDLGFFGDNLDKYNRLITNRQGVILVVGPTGSGKSSTMSTMIHALNSEEVNIVTLEDPVEYNIEGVNQVQVNEKTGVTFAGGLRSILRQDPDIIAVGEIRDTETADIAMRAAITGHLVLSTLHTANALSTLDRLQDMNVEPYMIANALKGIISQRLVRRICPHCKIGYTPSDTELEQLGMDLSATDVQFFRGEGCSECFGSGYRGRIVVAEILMMNTRIERAIHDGFGHDELVSAVKASSFVPLIDNCRDLVLAGTTTAEETFRMINTTD